MASVSFARVDKAYGTTKVIHETELLVRSGASDITVVTHGRASINPGDQIALRVAPGSVHLFDQKSGSRIPDVEAVAVTQEATRSATNDCSVASWI